MLEVVYPDSFDRVTMETSRRVHFGGGLDSSLGIQEKTDTSVYRQDERALAFICLKMDPLQAFHPRFRS